MTVVKDFIFKRRDVEEEAALRLKNIEITHFHIHLVRKVGRIRGYIKPITFFSLIKYVGEE